MQVSATGHRNNTLDKSRDGLARPRVKSYASKGAADEFRQRIIDHKRRVAAGAVSDKHDGIPRSANAVRAAKRFLKTVEQR